MQCISKPQDSRFPYLPGIDALRALERVRRERKQACPNLVEEEATLLFKSFFTPAAMPEAGTRPPMRSSRVTLSSS